MSLSISAVVCTHNRREPLLESLLSLLAQDLPKSDYEILVVDNASTDGTSELVRQRFGNAGNLRIVFEPRLGVAIARNTGARQARSNIVAYLDDDALAPPDYLRRFVELYAELEPSPGVIGGEMAPIFSADRPEWLTDEVLRWASAWLGWSKEPHWLPGDHSQWLCETNSAYRVDRLLEAGGFPENLGRVGDSLLSSEGFVNNVLHQAGFPGYFDPSIVVRHRVSAERMTRTWYRRRAFWQGVSSAVGRDYLKGRGVEEAVFRPLTVPCTPDDWVHLFDDRIADDDFPAVLTSILHIGYVLASQHLLRGR